MPRTNKILPDEPETRRTNNEGLGLDKIDYDNFFPITSINEDEEEVKRATPDWQSYRAIEKSLIWNKKYEFIQVRAKGEFRKKGTGEMVLIGLRVINRDPINTTVTDASKILELNQQILNPDTPESCSRYYLLKK